MDGRHQTSGRSNHTGRQSHHPPNAEVSRSFEGERSEGDKGSRELSRDQRFIEREGSRGLHRDSFRGAEGESRGRKRQRDDILDAHEESSRSQRESDRHRYDHHWRGGANPSKRRSLDVLDKHSSRHRSDWSHCGAQSAWNFSPDESRERGDHKRSRSYDERRHTEHTPTKRRRNHDRSRGSESHLPVGGATSSASPMRHDVAPYMSREVIGRGSGRGRRGGDGERQETEVCPSKVPPFTDTTLLVPSLPEKYYSCHGDREVASTELLTQLHAEFEHALLSVGGTIPSRWRLTPQCNDQATDESESRIDRQELDERIETDEPSDTSPEKPTCSTAISPVERPPLSHLTQKPKLHEDLSANIPSEVPIVCKRQHRCYGKGDAVDVSVNPRSYHSYAINVEPQVNFELRGLSRISSSDGKVYVFQGFSLLSHVSLDHLPLCKFVRFGGCYSINILKHPTMTNFVMKDALLLQEFFFVKLLQLYDWLEYMKPFSTELIFVPRFVCKKQGGECEVLSLAEVMHGLLTETRPATSDLINKTPGFLLFCPNKSPSCYRVDEVSASSSSHQKEVWLGHYCTQLKRKAKGQVVLQQKSEKKRYSDLTEKRQKKKLTRNEHFELRDLQEMLFGGGSTKQRLEQAGWVWLILQEGLLDTNIYYDIVQHTSLLPLISHHVLVYDSLTRLEEAIGYKFTDVQLLLRAVTHPSSSTLSYNVAEDNIKNTLTNGGLKWYEQQGTAGPPKKMNDLLAELEDLEKPTDEGQRLQNNEQLEYLGDALLEYQCSLYLYLKHPDVPVGDLVKKRQDIVKNHFLQQLAKKVDIQDYLLFNRKTNLPQSSFLHYAGNCIETILGAVFLDGGETEAKKLFGRLAFSENESEYEDWMNPGVDPVQSKYPDGDRHLVDDSDVLKSMVPLEEKCGITFRHISLLGRAFTHSSRQDTKLTIGNYQRLEFLGDAVLQFLVSKYIYFRLPAYNEGHFSMLRTALVHNKHLASLCQELGFQEFIITSESKKEHVEISVKIMADVVESFLGAVVLDRGLKEVEKFLQAHLFPKLSAVVKASQLVDSNTRLHQAAVYTCKKQGVKVQLPVYKKLAEEGTPGNSVYTVAIHYGNKEIARGSSGSLKEARRNAAENALKSGVFRVPPLQKTSEVKNTTERRT